MESETRKFKPIINHGQGSPCPPAPPFPIPPHPPGQIFQGCISYINSYIDARMRQLYAKFKDLINNINGKFNGPWDSIILEDTAKSHKHYKVYIKNGNLFSEFIDD